MIRKFEQACLRGVKAAFKKHLRFTGGMSLGFAPEAFIQGEIACALLGTAKYVTLESSVNYLLECAGAERRGTAPRNGNGRIDIATWWENGCPRVLIEVKKSYNHDSINADVKRLKQVLGRGGTSRDGIVVVYSDAKSPKTLNGRFKSIANKSNATQSLRTGARAYYPDGDSNVWYWEAICYRVYAKTWRSSRRS